MTEPRAVYDWICAKEILIIIIIIIIKIMFSRVCFMLSYEKLWEAVEF